MKQKDKYFPHLAIALSIILGVMFIGGAYMTAQNLQLAGAKIAHAQDESGQDCFWEPII